MHLQLAWYPIAAFRPIEGVALAMGKYGSTLRELKAPSRAILPAGRNPV
jgi:hypothetical protein